jgi:hypothetical protein
VIVALVAAFVVAACAALYASSLFNRYVLVWA